MAVHKKRVLVGSPIHQTPAILVEFLSSLRRLKADQVELGFCFIDDNENKVSSSILRHMVTTLSNVTVWSSGYRDAYTRNERTHYWSNQLIRKVADFKNKIIEHAIGEQYDYVFFVDSDLVLHPYTIEHLVTLQKDIVSEVFWTRWSPEQSELPQVWLYDEYKYWEHQAGEELSHAELSARSMQFVTMLRVPGVYEVGGLGACTLISREALLAGVNFDFIPNVTFWGEDRHFCIRAAAMRFKLYADTRYPPLHLYRESDLARVASFKEEIAQSIGKADPAPKRPHVTLSMCVRNEADRFLKEVLAAHRNCIDQAVIIDDASDDETVAICMKQLEGIPVKLVRNTASKFHNEHTLRKQQWEETISANPEWILFLDADELFEQRFQHDIHRELAETTADVLCFRLYDFWDEDHYRDDLYWRAHRTYRPFLLRYRPGTTYEWNDRAQHCGRMPTNVFSLPNAISSLRVKHMGWSRPDLRASKYERYMKLDPNGEFGAMAQYQSILDPNPALVKWEE